MYFRMLHEEASGKVAYLLADLDAGEAVVIDPRPADLAVLQALLAGHQLRLRWLLRTSTPAGAGGRGRPEALQALQAAQPAPQELPDLLSFGGEHLHVLRTPGPAPWAVSYLWRDRVFCGELLGAGDGAPEWPHSDADALWESVTGVLFALPPETLIFRGRARQGRIVSTVLAERRWHPWFGCASRDEFMARVARRPARA